MRTNKFFSPFLVTLALALSACGGDQPPPDLFLYVNSDSVVQNAVDEMQLIIRPSVSERFAATDALYENGDVHIFTSSAGELVMTFNKNWIDAHAEPGGSTFRLPVPLYRTSDADTPGGTDPRLEGSFWRRGTRIAQGEAFLMWPLATGTTSQVTVACSPLGRPECTNNDPRDAGPATDAGADM